MTDAELVGELSPTVIEAASWTLAAQMARRHPGVTVSRHHPGGGQYDCLAIRSESGLHIDLNRVGRIHVHATEGGGTPNWEPVQWSTYLETDPRKFIAVLEDRVRLRSVDALPSTTPRILTYRLISAFARLHALATPVEICMSTIDESGMGGGPASWIAEYPAVERMTADRPFGFWMAKSMDTEFVIETEVATVHRRDGSAVALPAKYSEFGRNFGRLLGFILSTS